MKLKITTLLFISFISLSLCAQDVRMSLVEYRKNINPLYGDASSFTFDLLKLYTVGEKDTSYQAIINVSDKSFEVQGGSIGFALFSNWNSAAGSNVQYNITKKKGSIILDYEEFLNLHDGAAKVFSYMTALKNSRTKHLEIRKYSQFVSIDVDRLTFAGEYSAGGSVDFFIRVDEAVFDLSYEQFYSFWKEISRAKKIWHTIRERRT